MAWLLAVRAVEFLWCHWPWPKSANVWAKEPGRRRLLSPSVWLTLQLFTRSHRLSLAPLCLLQSKNIFVMIILLLLLVHFFLYLFFFWLPWPASEKYYAASYFYQTCQPFPSLQLLRIPFFICFHLWKVVRRKSLESSLSVQVMADCCKLDWIAQRADESSVGPNSSATARRRSFASLHLGASPWPFACLIARTGPTVGRLMIMSWLYKAQHCVRCI